MQESQRQKLDNACHSDTESESGVGSGSGEPSTASNVSDCQVAFLTLLNNTQCSLASSSQLCSEECLSLYNDVFDNCHMLVSHV